jgi:uncharacterized membrane protein
VSAEVPGGGCRAAVVRLSQAGSVAALAGAAAAFAVAAAASAAAALREDGSVRALSHLVLPRSALHRRFPSHALTAIEEAIERSETKHRAEIRVAIGVALDLKTLWRVRTPRERALEVFAELGVWNTRERNGLLIYLLLAERDVEIVADSGFDDRVTDGEWHRVCTLIEREFAASRWRDGILVGIDAATVLLQREFPAEGGQGRNLNEQVDRPAVL